MDRLDRLVVGLCKQDDLVVVHLMVHLVVVLCIEDGLEVVLYCLVVVHLDRQVHHVLHVLLLAREVPRRARAPAPAPLLRHLRPAHALAHRAAAQQLRLALGVQQRGRQEAVVVAAEEERPGSRRAPALALLVATPRVR